MRRDASELAGRLAREAEAVCRHYLSNGKEDGAVLACRRRPQHAGPLVVRAAPGIVEGTRRQVERCRDRGTRRSPRLIRESLVCGFPRGRRGGETLSEVASHEQDFASKPDRPAVLGGSTEAARRLFAISSPIEGTVVETYLQRRGIIHVHHGGSLRFHPRCYYRPDEHLPTEIWPAMIACVTDLDGRITGVHRTWLNPGGFDRVRLGKAPIDTPRRAMGDLLGNALASAW
jgi:hypothetical protein